MHKLIEKLLLLKYLTCRLLKVVVSAEKLRRWELLGENMELSETELKEKLAVEPYTLVA